MPSAEHAQFERDSMSETGRNPQFNKKRVRVHYTSRLFDRIATL
jgi:hypothetical protein